MYIYSKQAYNQKVVITLIFSTTIKRIILLIKTIYNYYTKQSGII